MYPSSNSTKRTIGQVLSQLRETRHLGSTEVARALGTTSSTYLKMEREQRELKYSPIFRQFLEDNKK